MGMKTYQQQIAIANKKLRDYGKQIPNKSGIYTFVRRDENGIAWSYSGQALDIRKRIISHLCGYEHIDNSIRKRGLYSSENEHGWAIIYFTCDKSELDHKETETILLDMQKGRQSLNKTYGSQGKGKTATDNTVQKNYRQGVEYGQNKAIKAIAVYFEKYLDVSMKSGGKLQERKLAEFLELLNGSEKSNSCDET